MSTIHARKPAQRAKHVKWSVTVPPHLAQLAEEQVARGDAPSVSAVVTRALERALAPPSDEDDELDRLIQQWIDAGEVTITDEDREWVNRVLSR